MTTQNDFLPIATTGTPNVITQAVFAASPEAGAGFVSGLMPSAHLNKVLRQSSLMSNILAQFIIQQVTLPVVDNGTTATILASLTQAIQSAAFAGNLSVVTTGGTTTLTAAQAANAFITVTGALVSNATLVLPTRYGEWLVVNNTTGSFTLTSKTVAGTGVVTLQGRRDTVVCDSVNISYEGGSAITQAPLDNSASLATTAYADAAATAAASASLPQFMFQQAGVY